MDTPIWARYAAVALVFAAVMAVAYANFRLLVFTVMRRRVGRVARIAWPVLLLLLAFCIVDATCIEPNWPQVTHHTIKTRKMPAGSRVRIVQLADIHMIRLGARDIRMINLATRERPDVIVLTGDHSVEKDLLAQRQLTLIAKRLARIAPVYAIEGNWDTEDDMAALQRGGARLLDDWMAFQGRRGDQIVLGRALWYSNGVPCPPEWAQSLYKVVLCHSPEVFLRIDKRRVDLMLAGHTHGGQVRLPIFGALLPDRRLVGKYQAGMYSIGDSRLYVSRGIGLECAPAPQVRFWCRPEIAVIDIVGQSGR